MSMSLRYKGNDFLREEISRGKMAEKLPRCHISIIEGTQDEKFCLGGEMVLFTGQSGLAPVLGNAWIVNFMISGEKLVSKTIIYINEIVKTKFI